MRLLSALLLAPLALAFDPRAYSRQTATCKALNRATNTEVDIKLSYIDVNPTGKTTLILVHGWPSIWSTWARQIEEFEASRLFKDYHLIVPDLRGFGRSTHPGDVKSSGTLFDHVGDLVCILEHAKATPAVCVGHDWGSSVCYEAGRARPDVFNGVVGAVVPYIPAAGSFVPMKDLTSLFPKLTYQLYFDKKTAEAVEELDADIRRSLRSTLRSKSSVSPPEFLTSQNDFLGAYKDVKEIPPIPYFSSEEEDYMVEEFSVQGYRNTLQFYTTENRHASWKYSHDQGNHTISQPVLAIYPTDDPVADWAKAAKVLKSNSFLPSVTTEIVEGTHWIQLENPKQVNDAMRKWLDENFGSKHVADEL
ncbi:alpha/beta-hydrolase [Hymenopellis radicata]|nr:alpha/beta-hydrolase [Hymenopellis radicata]